MYTREVTLSGHIIDSLALPKTLDLIMDKGGDFKILEFEVGKRKKDSSTARIRVAAESESLLGEILDELSEIGALVVEIKEVQFLRSEKDKTLPPDFYSTTHHPTYIHCEGEWIPVEDIEMDCMIVFNPETKSAFCKPIGRIRKGDLVVVGREGIKVVPPERPRGKKGVFEFMSSEASSEKPIKSTVRKIASEIKEIKRNNGKIAVVAGPAVVHTGSAPVLAQMIKDGIVDVIFAGNALATHDIESALYGTSLGICVKSGEATVRGHKHHIYAINEINKAGSIREAVESGVLKKGIMYECIKNNAPYVLAGSIRDDGPLPDVITDVIDAQDEMRKYVKDVDMVIMISTMLHSIAVGNILPSHVKSICVDINPATVTKLADRGSAQVVGIVTDVGAFLPMLNEELKRD
ncbi:ornithine cyclodeaminase [Methanobacterium aggregans]|uniref:ornithine cyclodeaminase n=1 Tax=Methanobacterium aggregans TaxID=1615586 RepID=UPI001AE1D492|nr:TIGR00300 family protein [Methanobacterium aggregans]MBP2045672.1 lysine-ketoglutarate reductase/saccharopine dehydrogenase-like protein (TIGR00300 family) [Methanobacterium aggregans]